MRDRHEAGDQREQIGRRPAEHQGERAHESENHDQIASAEVHGRDQSRGEQSAG